MKYKYRIPALLLALILTLSFQCSPVWAENEGEDAHSQSMSTESGDEPIEDFETTEDVTDTGEVLYVEEPSAEESEDESEEEGLDAEAQDVGDEAEETEDLAEEDFGEEPVDYSEEEDSSHAPWVLIITGVIAAAALIVTLVLFIRGNYSGRGRRSGGGRSKGRGSYKSKK